MIKECAFLLQCKKSACEDSTSINQYQTLYRIASIPLVREYSINKCLRVSTEHPHIQRDTILKFF